MPSKAPSSNCLNDVKLFWIALYFDILLICALRVQALLSDELLKSFIPVTPHIGAVNQNSPPKPNLVRR